VPRTKNNEDDRVMSAQEKLLLSAVATLLFSGCAGEYLAGPYEGPYYSDFGPYYPGYAPFYDGDFVVGGVHYRNHFGGHHFYGRSFATRHFAVVHGPVGVRPTSRPAIRGGQPHGGGFHR
jgi:hypothetical protein